ncbi:MAG: DUF2721 domain-containing protein [Arenicella sp.]
MTLNISDPAILFPGISLLFLAYTNRYLAIANIIRQLNKVIDDHYDENREQQIQGLLIRIKLIRYMQLFGILAFILCTISISALLLGSELFGKIAFGTSIASMFVSLCVAFLEVAKSGDGLRIEIERTHPKKPK